MAGLAFGAGLGQHARWAAGALPPEGWEGPHTGVLHKHTQPHLSANSPLIAQQKQSKMGQGLPLVPQLLSRA